jgi:hypothetical protein
MTTGILREYFREIIFLLMIFCFSSCGQQDPKGKFKGEIQDWEYEVFEGPLLANDQLCQITVVFKQVPEGLVSTLFFHQPGMKEVVREGNWKMEDGYRSIFFSDGKEPSKYFLIKKGVRYAFQTKDGLTNDDGSPILLMRNVGKSRKKGYPFLVSFLADGKVTVETMGESNLFKGNWAWNGGKITVKVKLESDGRIKNNASSETYKYFLSWGSDGNYLHLEKMLITRPFKKDDGSMRQSWMSSLIFSDQPKLRPF